MLVDVQIDASRPLPLLLVLLPTVLGVFLFLLLMTSTSCCCSSSSGKVRDPCMVSVSGDCLLAFDCLQLRRFCGAGAGAVACLACASSSSSFSSVAFLVVDMR